MATIQAPDGTEWVVVVDTAGPRLRWRPAHWWRARRKRRAAERNAAGESAASSSRWTDWIDLPAFDLDDLWFFLVVVAAAAAFVLLALLVGFVVLPIVLVLVDIVLLVVGVAGLFLWRTVTRSGWTVIAVSASGEARRWHVPGWFAARRAKRAIAAAIASGSPIVVSDAVEVAGPD